MGYIHTKTLLQFNGEDFELYESQEHTLTYFNISIEGYMGFYTIKSVIESYTMFLDKLKKYLEENHEKTEKHGWKCVYQTRAIDVCYEGDCYWVFLDTFKSSEAWDTYYYMEGVIRQLSEIKEDLIHSNLTK
jgi:hypothetical protein